MVSNGYILLAGGDAAQAAGPAPGLFPPVRHLRGGRRADGPGSAYRRAPGRPGAFLGGPPPADGCGVLAAWPARPGRRLPVFILDSGAEPPCWTGAGSWGRRISSGPEAEPAAAGRKPSGPLPPAPAPQGEDSGEGSWPPAAATAAQAICAALEARDAESGGHVRRVGAAAGELLHTLAPLCPEYGLTDARTAW